MNNWPDKNHKKRSSQEYWRQQSNQFVDHYQETIGQRFVHNFLKRRFKIISGLIEKEVSQRSVVLDIGCGSGIYLAYLAQFRPEKLIGLDYSEEMIKETGRNLEKFIQNGQSVELIQSRADQINLADQSSDLILAIGLFDYLAAPEQVLSEIRRILKKGGRAIITLPKKYSPFFFLRHWPFLYLRRKLFKLPPIVNCWSKQEALDFFRRFELKVIGLNQLQRTMWIFELEKL